MAQLSLEDGNFEYNLGLAESAVAEAARQQVDLLNLPEAADWGWLHQQARRDAFSVPGKYANSLCDLARGHRLWISAGCLEKAGAKVYNAAVFINRMGHIVLKHRKIDTLPWLTQRLYDPADVDHIEIAATEFGRIGLTICADNFNPRYPRRVAELGAWLLIAPHGFAAEKTKLRQNSEEYKGHICNVARNTGLWVIGTNSVKGIVQGGAWKGRLHSGCSVVARPDGTPAVVARFKEPDLVIFDIPPSPLADQTSLGNSSAGIK